MLGRLLADYHHRAIHLPRTERIARSLSTLLSRYDQPVSLLDVGCGDGVVARQIAERLGTGQVHGVDIKLRASSAIEVQEYDGQRLPFDDGQFDVVMLSDVLHHAYDAEALLRDCLRVARRAVAIKDHLAFGFFSDKLLWLMDVAGNAAPGVEVRGNYLQPQQWFELVDRVGGRICAVDWPLRIHDLPWRVLTRSELQFAALVEPRTAREGSGG
jgi:SAM-dependent methyltransferase